MQGDIGADAGTAAAGHASACYTQLDRSQSLFYFVPQEYHSQAGSTRLKKIIWSGRIDQITPKNGSSIRLLFPSRIRLLVPISVSKHLWGSYTILGKQGNLGISIRVSENDFKKGDVP